MTRRVSAVLASLSLAAMSAYADVKLRIDFIPGTPAHGYAARTYESIWNEHGERIVAALEARTCIPLAEEHVAAVVEDATSHSGGPNHPMRLRASYPLALKQSTLVHELGHRHLWQLAERFDYLDGHKTLYLILDRVWADVWGEEFAAAQIQRESSWLADYDYAAAWRWALNLVPAERARLWNRLRWMNGFTGDCAGPLDDPTQSLSADAS